MMDLTAFDVELRDSTEDERDKPGEDSDSAWSECIDCGYVGYEVKSRRSDGVPLCPGCFADREGLL